MILEKVTKEEKNIVELEITVPADEFESKLSSAIVVEVHDTPKIPEGFGKKKKKGKSARLRVPKDVILSTCGGYPTIWKFEYRNGKYKYIKNW